MSNKLNVDDIIELKEAHYEFINLLNKILEKKEVEYDGIKISLINIKTLAFNQNEILEKLVWAFDMIEKNKIKGE